MELGKSCSHLKDVGGDFYEYHDTLHHSVHFNNNILIKKNI